MNLQKVKLYVDVVLFLDIVLLALTGFILWGVYPAGEKSGQAGIIFLFDKFAWLGFHEFTSVVFVILLVVHLLLNWRWINCMLFRHKIKGNNKE